MGRRLAMIAAEGNFESPWLRATGKESEVRVTGTGIIELHRNYGDVVGVHEIPLGHSELPDMSKVESYRFTKRAIAADEPTTVEVIC